METAIKKKHNIATYILIGMVAGIIAGLLLKLMPAGMLRDTIIIGGIIEVIGTIFMNLLKMIVVPLVFVSIICGMGALKDVRQIGRIGAKTFALYLLTTAIAIILALVLSIAFNVGANLDMTSTLTTDIKVPEVAGLAATIIGIFPTNIFESFVNGNMLQILFVAIFFGTCLTLAGDVGKPVTNFFESVNQILIKMVFAILKIAPFAVFCLMTKAIFNVGTAAIFPLLKYFAVFMLVILMQAFVVYGGLVGLMARLSPIPFFKKYGHIAPMAFSLSSSNAMLPVSMKCCANMGISRKVYAFSLPLGATINMDGTAIVQAVSVIFLSKIYGLELTIPVLLTVLITTLLISIGSPAVPGGSHITLAVILQTIGIPIEGIALIMGFERLCGMTLTTLNIMGDNMCALLVSKSEKELDIEQYKKMDATV